MKTKYLVTGFAAASAVAVGLFLFFSRATESSEQNLSAGVEDAINTPSVPVSVRRVDAQVKPVEVADENSHALTSSRATEVKHAASSKNTHRAFDGTPITEKEARWLADAGFPSYQRQGKTTNEQQLAAELASGNPVAKVMLGSLLAQRPQDRERGLQLLHEAAAEGSIFALHELRNLNMLPQRQGNGEMVPPQLVHAAAYQQAALALGDLAMAAPFRDFRGNPLPMELQSQANVLTAMILDQLNRISVQRRGVPLQPRLRPSFEPVPPSFVPGLPNG